MLLSMWAAGSKQEDQMPRQAQILCRKVDSCQLLVELWRKMSTLYDYTSTVSGFGGACICLGSFWIRSYKALWPSLLGTTSPHKRPNITLHHCSQWAASSGEWQKSVMNVVTEGLPGDGLKGRGQHMAASSDWWRSELDPLHILLFWSSLPLDFGTMPLSTKMSSLQPHA